MDITWTEEVAAVKKFQGTVPNGPTFELTLTRSADGTITATNVQNATIGMGSLQIPGDWAGAKTFFTSIGADL